MRSSEDAVAVIGERLACASADLDKVLELLLPASPADAIGTLAASR